MDEDPYSGEKSVLPNDPTAADYEPGIGVFRSLAAIGIVYGLSGMLLVPFGLERFLQGAQVGDLDAAIFVQPIQSLSVQALWLLCSTLVGAGLGAALMVGALGGVLLKSWSLLVLRLWAVASIIFGVAGSSFYFTWILVPPPPQIAQVRGVDDALFNLGGWAIGTILAVAMLIVSNRSVVREALARDGNIVSPRPHFLA